MQVWILRIQDFSNRTYTFSSSIFRARSVQGGCGRNSNSHEDNSNYVYYHFRIYLIGLPLIWLMIIHSFWRVYIENCKCAKMLCNQSDLTWKVKDLVCNKVPQNDISLSCLFLPSGNVQLSFADMWVVKAILCMFAKWWVKSYMKYEPLI